MLALHRLFLTIDAKFPAGRAKLRRVGEEWHAGEIDGEPSIQIARFGRCDALRDTFGRAVSSEFLINYDNATGRRKGRRLAAAADASSA
jgi:hypothetical protein